MTKSKKRKYKYKFDPNTLRYEKVRMGIKERLKEVSFGLAFGIVSAVVITILSYKIIDSPKEKALKREITQYKHQINILNKRTEQMSEVLEDIETETTIYIAPFLKLNLFLKIYAEVA